MPGSVALSLALALAAPDVPSPAEMRGSVAPLVDRVKGAVVTIQSTTIVRRARQDDPWGNLFGRPRYSQEKVEGLGSGFIVDREGTVLTNNHVVAGASQVLVRLADNRAFEAKVVGRDPPTDVAVIRLDKPPRDLQVASLGDSDRVRVGDYVLAIGNPLGLGQTVTMGIVSAKNRALKERLGDLDPRYQDFIQTDAAINQGNSGGPLFNFAGEVVGVNSAILNPGIAMNVGFAIPINLARSIADQLRKSGSVARGYLGVGSEDFLPQQAQELRMAHTPGALINFVGPGTPAEKAGLQPNDVVVELGGRPIDGTRRLSIAVASFRPGESVKLAYLRGGKRIETKVAMASPVPAGDDLFLGIRARPLDARRAQALGLRAGLGAVVVYVDPQGGASGNVREGDLILAINGQPATLADFKAVEGWVKSGRHAEITLQRGNQRFNLHLTE